jgi:translation initiation factor eIF-2B subunit beta
MNNEGIPDFDLAAATAKWMVAVRGAADALAVQLKRGEVTGSGVCATATAELLRASINRGRFSSTREMIAIVAAIGRKLIAAQPLELAIGNMVRRVLFLIRNEYRIALDEAKSEAEEEPADVKSLNVAVPDGPSSSSSSSSGALAVSTSSSSLSSGLVGRPSSSSITSPSPLTRTQSVATAHSMPSLATFLESGLNQSPSHQANSQKAQGFVASIKPNVIDEITELMEDIKNVPSNIRDQAVEHVYANEVRDRRVMSCIPMCL